MSDSPLVPLRNTISGVIHEFTAEQAEQFLAHPIFGATLELATVAVNPKAANIPAESPKEK